MGNKNLCLPVCLRAVCKAVELSSLFSVENT